MVGGHQDSPPSVLRTAPYVDKIASMQLLQDDRIDLNSPPQPTSSIQDLHHKTWKTLRESSLEEDHRATVEDSRT